MKTKEELLAMSVEQLVSYISEREESFTSDFQLLHRQD